MNATEATASSVVADAELVAAGEVLFAQCRACHQVGDDAGNGEGPHLNGIIGRAAGSVADYRYSRALTQAGEADLVWDAVSPRDFLADPHDYLNGVPCPAVSSDADIAAIVAYLAAIDS